MPPLWRAGTLLEPGPVIHFQPDAVRRILNEQQQQVFDDHAPYDCLQLAVVERSDYAYLVVKRRSWRLKQRLPAKVPYSDILYCSAPQILTRHLERVKLAILRKQRTVALVADARLLWPEQPRGILIPTHACYRSPLFVAGEIDNLYSELVLLPI